MPVDAFGNRTDYTHYMFRYKHDGKRGMVRVLIGGTVGDLKAALAAETGADASSMGIKVRDQVFYPDYAPLSGFENFLKEMNYAVIE